MVVKDIDTGKFHVFTNPQTLKDYLLNPVDLVLAHNGIDFDLYQLSRLWGIEFDRTKVRDTLVLSRLLNQQLPSGHSLESWGQRLGFPKSDFNDFSQLSKAMIDYCVNDVELTHRLWVYLQSKMSDEHWKSSIVIEHEMHYICKEMQINGFSFDIKTATDIYNEITGTINKLDVEIQKAFPPRLVLKATYDIKTKKDGTYDKRTQERIARASLFDPTFVYSGGRFNEYTWETFNPTSQKQVIERLDGYWEPTDKTKGHLEAIKNKSEKLPHFEKYGWSINEVNLATLKNDAPEAAKLLVKRIFYGARERILKAWIESYNKDTGKIHGTFNSLGTWTHRLSHTNPNLGNVSAEKTIKYKTEELRSLAISYGGRLRRLFTNDRDSWLIGCDMEGAHLRLFAHFISDEALIHALVSGDKRLGTDPHSLNKQKLGDICPDRDLAKTFIFTFLNGGGVGKVAEIFRCPVPIARDSLNGFIESYPGLKTIREDVFPIDADRGWFYGLDGRKVPCTSTHLMMAGYLQNGEAVVMKHANVLWQKELKKLQIPFRQVNLVHDEFQTNIIGDEAMARKAMEVQAWSIKQTGINLGIICPLAGEASIGTNWLETH